MEIETKHLIIREFQPEDFTELAPIMADPKGMKFFPALALLLLSLKHKARYQAPLLNTENMALGNGQLFLRRIVA